MKRTLIFNDYIGGHQLEYVHHLYMDAINKPDNEYYFAVPLKRFQEDSSKFVWPKSSNVKMVYLAEEDLADVHSNYLKKSYHQSKLLRKTIKETNATHVFLIELINFLPCLPFLIRNKTKVSGIIYKINLYRRKNSNLFIRFQDVLKEIIFVRCRVFDKVFILNDKAATMCLNKIYKINKFHFLPDPIIPIQKTSLMDLRSQLNIDDSKTVILHPGGPERRKGSIEIFKAIDKISQDTRNQYTFIYAGRVPNVIKDKFYFYYNKLKDVVQMIVFDEFCSFELLGSLFHTCDAILIPYMETAQSSGIIGFAAQFKKPVIAPKGGLIGKIVKRNHLGILLDSYKCDSIVDYLESPIEWKYVKNDYLETNSVSVFLDIIDI